MNGRKEQQSNYERVPLAGVQETRSLTSEEKTDEREHTLIL